MPLMQNLVAAGSLSVLAVELMVYLFLRTMTEFWLHGFSYFTTPTRSMKLSVSEPPVVRRIKTPSSTRSSTPTRFAKSLEESQRKYSQSGFADDYDSWRKAVAKRNLRKSVRIHEPTVKAISEVQSELRESIDERNYDKVIEILRNKVLRSGKIVVDSEEFYGGLFEGNPDIVQDYVETIHESISTIRDCPKESISPEIVSELKSLSNDFGETALCLSGGATLSFFHLGVLRCMVDNGCLPKVLSGASAGSLIASFPGTFTDEELDAFLHPNSHTVFRAFGEKHSVRVKRFWAYKSLLSNERMAALVQKVHGDITFLEAYKRSGRILNISVTCWRMGGKALVLNYKTTPNVTVWSAIIASSSLPGAMRPQALMEKDKDGFIREMPGQELWLDGSLLNDVPRVEMERLFNVKYVIVSQVNPHVVPLLKLRLPTFKDTRYLGYRPKSPIGFGFLSVFETFLRLDIVRTLRFLGEMDLMPYIGGADWRRLFLQKFDGDVTVSLNFDMDYFWGFLKLTSDPNFDDLAKYIEVGQQMLYPKLFMIQNHFAVKAAIERAVSERC